MPFFWFAAPSKLSPANLGTSKNLEIAVIPANNHKGRAGREPNFI
jgi:hypothetical protein